MTSTYNRAPQKFLQPLKTTVLWGLTPCLLGDRHRRFGRSYFLYFLQINKGSWFLRNIVIVNLLNQRCTIPGTKLFERLNLVWQRLMYVDPQYGTIWRQFRAGPSWPCPKLSSKPTWHKPMPNVQWETPDDGQRNCPKHVEFYAKINLRY